MNRPHDTDSLPSTRAKIRRIAHEEQDKFKAQLAAFPHTFQLQDLEKMNPNQMKRVKSGLESALSVGYKTDLETARARNLLAFALWCLERRDEALQQLDLVLDMEDQHNNLVTLADKAVVLWNLVQRDEAQEQVQKLLEIQGNDENFRYLVVKAKAELAFSYTRLGPTFCSSAIKVFDEVIPEAKEPEKWLWKFGLALTARRLHRATPNLCLMQSHRRSELLALLKSFHELAEQRISDNLKAKVYAEIALLLQSAWQFRSAKSDASKETRMTPIEACKKALELDNDDNSVLCKCGKVFRYAREPEKSRELFEKAVSIRPSATGYHHLGLTYKALATKENHKRTPKAPSNSPNVQSQHRQRHESPDSNSSFVEQVGPQATASGSPRYVGSDDTLASDGQEGPRLSSNKDVRMVQRAIKSPPKGTTSFSREGKFVKEALENLEKAIAFSENENTSAIYDLALMHKSLGEFEESRKHLQSMINNCKCMLPLEEINAYEQIGLVMRQMAEFESDQKRKKDIYGKSDTMLMLALKTASLTFSGSLDVGIEEVWNSFSTLFQAVKNSDEETYKKHQKQAKLLQLIQRHKQSLDLLEEIEQMDPEKAKDPEHLRLCIEAYMATKGYNKTSTFLGLLKCTSQGRKTMELFDDKHFALKIYLKAARETLDQDWPNAKVHFRSAFHEAMAVRNASSSLASSPGDRNTSRSQTTLASSPGDHSDTSSSQTTSRNTVPVTVSDVVGASAMSANDPTADTKHWEVILLHEEDQDSIRKADSLIHVLQTVCGLRVTSRHRALAPGTPEWILSKLMEKCQVVAVLAKTGDHNDEMLSYLIRLTALRPSTVTLLAEGAHVPDPLKGHRSFHCPDQLLHFKDEACAELNADIIDSVFQLFAFLCHVTL